MDASTRTTSRHASPADRWEGSEFTLVELWQAAVRRKMLIAASFVLCMLVGGAYLALKTPLYDARATVRIGQVGGTGSFEAVDVVSARLLAQYGEEISDGVLREPPFLERAGPLAGAPTMLDLVARAASPEEAVALLDKIVAELMSSHGGVYAKNVEGLTRRLAAVEQQLLALERTSRAAAELFGKVRESDPVQASLIVLERARIEERINALEAERPRLAQVLSPPMTLETEAFGSIMAPTRPATPKTRIVLVVAGIVGILAGMILAVATAFANGGVRTNDGGSP